jgi:hypothetical protein
VVVMTAFDEDFLLRFWARVDVRGVDECWLWKGPTGDKGYGQPRHRGKKFKAHRVSWMLHRGDIPEGLWVLHCCDERYEPGDITNRRCVNPAHLRLGTLIDNNRDTEEKGRAVRVFGETHGRCVVTSAQVASMLERKARGEKVPSIHRDFPHTSLSNVKKICHGLRRQAAR